MKPFVQLRRRAGSAPPNDNWQCVQRLQHLAAKLENSRRFSMMAATCKHALLLIRLACWSMVAVVGQGALGTAPGPSQEEPLPDPTPIPSFFVKQLGISEFQQFINSSSVGIVYFQRRDSKRIQAFLREFEKSAQRLHAFAIHLGKVDCTQHVVDNYCQDERSFHNAFGFRDAKEKIALPLDTLFDVDSIVSSALHLALIHNVPIIQSHRERLALENKCKRRFDIIFTYQRALGTYEHRVFLELAFTFLDKYVFALTTHELATQGLRRSSREVDRGDEEAPGADSAIWALFCQETGDISDECSQSAFYGPVHLMELVNFIHALDHPPWSLFDGRQERPFATPSSMHSLYLFHDGKSETEAVTSLADRLARKFRGSLAVILVSRSSLGPEGAVALGLSVDDIQDSGIALRLRLQNGLQWIDEADAERLIAEKLKDWPYGEPDRIESNRDADQDQRDQLAELRQDDDVAEHVRRMQHFSSLPVVTGNNFADLMQRPLTAVLFYVNWDPRSQVMLEILSVIQVALQLADDFPSGASVFTLNCFDWPELCQARNVSAYPTLHIVAQTQEISSYNGLLKQDAVSAALYLCWTPNLVPLTNIEEAIEFVSGNRPSSLRRYVTSVILIGFSSQEFPQSVSLVDQLSQQLRDVSVIGYVRDDVAFEIGGHHGVSRLPFLLVFKWNDPFQPIVRMSETHPFNVASITQFLSNASLPVYDELTADNFPEYWQRAQLHNNHLVMYVTPDHRNDPMWSDIATIATIAMFPQLTFSWMSTQNLQTRELLKFYKLEEDKSAVIVLDFQQKIYFTLENKHLVTEGATKYLRGWLTRLADGQLPPSGYLRDNKWKPLHPGFDYLRLIDEDMDRELDDQWNDDPMIDAGGTGNTEKMYPKFRNLRMNRVGHEVRSASVAPKHVKVEL